MSSRTQEALAINGGTPAHAGAPIPLSKVCWTSGEKSAVDRVFHSGLFCSCTKRHEVRALEREFADPSRGALRRRLSLGHAAQHAALVALGIGPGDEVTCRPFTFSRLLTPRSSPAPCPSADVSRDTITLDPEQIRGASPAPPAPSSPSTGFGHPADYGRYHGDRRGEAST